MHNVRWSAVLQNITSLRICPEKKVVILANLEPRKIRGIESEGMILMAESGDGQLHFIQATSEESGMTIS